MMGLDELLGARPGQGTVRAGTDRYKDEKSRRGQDGSCITILTMPTYRVHFTKAKPGTSEIDVTADAMRVAGNYMYLDGPNGPKFLAERSERALH